MLLPLPTRPAPAARSLAAGGVVPFPARAAREADRGPSVAVLVTGCDDVAAVLRGYRTVLPRARLVLCGHGLAAEARAAAAAAGAEVRPVPPLARDALVRRMLAELDADITILAHGAVPGDVCVAPLLVAEVDGGKDLVDVQRVGAPPSGGPADRLLARSVDFLFGGRGDLLTSDFKAVSRRLALSYRRTAPSDGPHDASARDLALHALRLRLPVGRVAALDVGPVRPAPPRGAAARLAPAVLAVRLVVEERPRRAFGLLGLSIVALGLATAAPEIHRWTAPAVPNPRTLAAAALLAAGIATGAVGVLLDAVASARHEVRRLGAAAIPRRADRGAAAADRQSSVS